MAGRTLHAVPFFPVLGFWIALRENDSNFIEVILQSTQNRLAIAFSQGQINEFTHRNLISFFV